MGGLTQKSTKRAESFENAILLFLGFGVAAYFKVDAQIFGMYVLGIAGKQTGFMWGKSQEYKANVAMGTRTAETPQ